MGKILDKLKHIWAYNEALNDEHQKLRQKLAEIEDLFVKEIKNIRASDGIMTKFGFGYLKALEETESKIKKILENK